MNERDRGENRKPVDSIHIPELGEFAVINAVDGEGCVDPRKSRSFLNDIKGVLTQNVSFALREHHKEGWERSPGASFGKAMSLAAACPDLSPEQAIDLVYAWQEMEGRIFTLHDAAHVEKDSLGCGHVDKAAKVENEPLYGIPSKKVISMRDYIAQLAREGWKTPIVPMLTNAHQEKGVLVVVSTDKTVQPTNGATELFRFDKTRHDMSMHRLARFVRQNGVNLSPNILLAEAERQRNATLMLLAGGLPIYEADLRNNARRVTHKGFVPQRAA